MIQQRAFDIGAGLAQIVGQLGVFEKLQEAQVTFVLQDLSQVAVGSRCVVGGQIEVVGQGRLG